MQAVGLATSFSSRQFGLSTKLLSFSASQFAAGMSDGPGWPAAVALLVGRNFWLYRSITYSLIELGRAEEDVLPVVVQLDDPLQEGRARTWRLLAELARPRKD